jgi:phosphomannomutase/phosphoglucomutase
LKLKYFGTSGIRGRTFIDITPQLAQRMAVSYAQVVLLGIENPSIVIGRDPRFGAESIEMAVIAGLTSVGVSVIRCGIVPTPVLLTYQKYTKADGAIMITGSHIPPDRIGLIFIGSDGAYCSDHVCFAIEQVYDDKNFSGLPEINSIGDLLSTGSIINAVNVFEVYEEFITPLIDLEKIKSHPFRLVIDAGNGTASYFVTKFLGNLGLDITAINDYHAPISARLSEPIDENLSRLKELVVKNVDLGIAFDLDADRVTFVHYKENGKTETISANIIGAFMLKYLLSNEHVGQVILPINSSMLAEEILKQFDLKPIYCKIGQPGTVEAIKKVPNAIYSYEESGKFYLLNYGILWTDGILMMLKILELLATSGVSLEHFIELLPKYYSFYDKIEIKDDKMNDTVKLLQTNILNYTFTDEIARVSVDGHRINFKEGWLLIRPSGTEPKIRIMSDSSNEEFSKNLLEKGMKFVQEIISRVQ